MRNWKLWLRLEADGPEPVYRQLTHGLVQAIRDGRLRPGTALPGTRELATALGVNRKTVVQAYDEALAQGWLLSQPRRGTFVNQGLGLPSGRQSPVHPDRSFLPPFEPAAVPAFLWERTAPPPGTLTFDNGAPDTRLLRLPMLRRAHGRALRRVAGHGGLGYEAAPSSTALCEALAGMLRQTRGLPVDAGHVCLTRGTRMAFHAIALALLRPGDCVVVERLSYPPAWAAFQAHGAEVVGIDVDEEGLQVDRLEVLCRSRPVRMLYLTPHHQFPTTVTLKRARRQKLLALAERHNFVVLEEDYDHEFHFAGRPHPPLASDERQRQVVYVGSLSKVLAPSMRCGFIVAPPNLVVALRRMVSLLAGQGDAVNDTMLADLLTTGELRAHLRRAARAYRARRDILSECLHAQFRGQVSFEVPQGGLALWVRFDPGLRVDSWQPHAAAQGLRLRLVREFALEGPQPDALRLGFASLDPDEVREAVRRLAAAARAARRV